MNWRHLFANITVVVLAGIAPALSQDTSQDVQVEVHVSQTAIFPGDTILYSLDINATPNVEILPGDLDIARLNLTGLEPVAFELESNETGNGTRYKVRYFLTSYEIDTPSVVIGEQSVRYYVRQPGVRAETAIPENEFIVPARTIGLRSTLPEGPDNLVIRDDTFLYGIPSYTFWTGIAGMGLILFSGLPVAWWGVYFARRQIAVFKQKQIASKHVAHDEVTDELEGLDADAVISRRDGYEIMERILRDHLVQYIGTRAYALTVADITDDFPDEIAGVPTEKLADLLETCQLARYGKPEYLPAADLFRTHISVVQGLQNSG